MNAISHEGTGHEDVSKLLSYSPTLLEKQGDIFFYQ